MASTRAVEGDLRGEAIAKATTESDGGGGGGGEVRVVFRGA